jgi:predicted nucleotidyltransferase
MPVIAQKEDFLVTDAKIATLVDRIAAALDPQEIIMFGSRARGDHRQESDLDLAVIMEAETPETRKKLSEAASGRRMSVDLLLMSRERFDKYRPWINTVERQIDREGVRLYVRGRQSTHTAAA